MQTRKIRMWPVYLIGSGVTISLLLIWLLPSLNRQTQVMRSIAALALGLLLTLLWALLFSRFRAKVRLLVLAGVAVFGFLIYSTVSLRGFTGDLIPILEFKWNAAGPDAIRTSGTTVLLTEDTEKGWFNTDNYPQYLGPNRDAVLSGVKLDPNWQDNPPAEVWRRKIGEGWSAFAVWGKAAITQEQRGPLEMVVCYDLPTGKVYWSHSDSARFAKPIAGTGPRATPVIDGERVYTMGATGKLNCLDLQTGIMHWQRDIVAEFGGSEVSWGNSRSPLLLDTLLVVGVGGEGKTLMAFNAKTGAVVWQGGDTELSAGYSSPTYTILANTPQILSFNGPNLSSHSPADGQVLWTHDWASPMIAAAQPVVLAEDRVFLSSGYGKGAELVKVSQNENGGLQPSLLWKSLRMKAKFCNVVEYQNHLYGLDDGILACIDVAEGKRQWKRGRYGHGQILLVDDLLIVLTESGELVLVRPDPAKLQELGRMSILEGKTWNTPILAGNYLLARNDREAVCYKMPLL